MSDIKLFRIGKDSRARELAARPPTAEKSFQQLLEGQLDAFLGVTLLASEYATGKTHGGRIDSLGIDENRCPVIVEYKRSTSQNVINQGLFYLDWLLDHKAEFSLLVIDRLGRQAADAIEWSSPRLLCLASDFTRYDEHAVKQINRNIELVRYRLYGRDLVLLELVNANVAAEAGVAASGRGGKTVLEYLAQSPPELVALFDELRARLLGLGDDVQLRTLKHYFAFRRLQNFACVEVHPQSGKLLVYVKARPTARLLRSPLARDVTNVGHYGTGDLELTLRTPEDLDFALPVVAGSYEAN